MNGETSIGRRGLLVGAGMGLGALAVGAAGAPVPAAAEEPGDGGVNGSWLVTLNFNPLPPPLPTPPTETAVNSFAAGGVFAAIVLGSPGGAPALGTWELTGDHAYQATVWQTESIAANQTIVLRVMLRGRFDREKITSTFAFDVFLPSNLVTPIATGSGVSSGSRIVA